MTKGFARVIRDRFGRPERLYLNSTVSTAAGFERGTRVTVTLVDGRLIAKADPEGESTLLGVGETSATELGSTYRLHQCQWSALVVSATAKPGEVHIDPAKEPTAAEYRSGRGKQNLRKGAVPLTVSTKARATWAKEELTEVLALARVVLGGWPNPAFLDARASTLPASPTFYRHFGGMTQARVAAKALVVPDEPLEAQSILLEKYGIELAVNTATITLEVDGELGKALIEYSKRQHVRVSVAVERLLRKAFSL